MHSPPVTAPQELGGTRKQWFMFNNEEWAAFVWKKRWGCWISEEMPEKGVARA
jgi:hypothetical protein